jgi:hypothetical protein
MNRLAELIRSLGAQDVQLIQQDIEQGNLSRVVRERLAELEMPQKVCPVCSAPLEDDAPFVLYFGTLVRKKARFDGLDCLRFFLNDLEGEKEKGRATRRQ